MVNLKTKFQLIMWGSNKSKVLAWPIDSSGWWSLLASKHIELETQVGMNPNPGKNFSLKLTTFLGTFLQFIDFNIANFFD